MNYCLPRYRRRFSFKKFAMAAWYGVLVIFSGIALLENLAYNALLARQWKTSLPAPHSKTPQAFLEVIPDPEDPLKFLEAALDDPVGVGRADAELLVRIPRNARKTLASIDAVITYCNGSDPKFMAGVAKAIADAGRVLSSSASKNRFADHEDLKMLLRSLDLYGKMFGKVFLVVSDSGQIPNWLNQSNPKIEIVFHKDIWNAPSQLPVFQSFAIEANLHHIRGLSEYFVYFNDDFSLVNKVGLTSFFSYDRRNPDGVAIKIRLNPTSILGQTKISPAAKHVSGPLATATRALSRNCPMVLGQSLSSRIKGLGYMPIHAPYTLRRSVLYKAEKQPGLAEHFHRTSASKLRNGNELNTVALFNGWIQCGENETVVCCKDNSDFFIQVDDGLEDPGENRLRSLKDDIKRNERLIETQQVLFLGINDDSHSGPSTEVGLKISKLAYDWRRSLFPEKSSFEIS